MNYLKLYYKWLDYFLTTTPIQRLIVRDITDKRLTTKLYVEQHHILPKKLGGLDIKENYVSLLPEEHLFLHKLRYKAFQNRVDYLAVRIMCNMSLRKHGNIVVTNIRLTQQIRRTYGWSR